MAQLFGIVALDFPQQSSACDPQVPAIPSAEMRKKNGSDDSVCAFQDLLKKLVQISKLKLVATKPEKKTSKAVPATLTITQKKTFQLLGADHQWPRPPE